MLFIFFPEYYFVVCNRKTVTNYRICYFSGDCLVVCNGNGQYIGGVCHCIQGWKGQECNVPENECALPDCNGNGYCHEGECHCDTGFQGPHCGIGKALNGSLKFIKMEFGIMENGFTVLGNSILCRN